MPGLENQFRTDAKVARLPQHDVSEPAGRERSYLARDAVGDRRVDRVLGQVAQHTLIVVGAEAVIGERGSLAHPGSLDGWRLLPASAGGSAAPCFHRVSELPCTPDGLADP